MNMVRLLAPKGTDEANFGVHAFRVDNDGTVLVPEEAVPGLVGEGGFTLIDVEPALPHGFARVVHTDPTAVCGGERLADGSFVVPVASVNELVAHGWRGVDGFIRHERAEPKPLPVAHEPAPAVDLEPLKLELAQHKEEILKLHGVHEMQNDEIEALKGIVGTATGHIDELKKQVADQHGMLELLTAPDASKTEGEGKPKS